MPANRNDPWRDDGPLAWAAFLRAHATVVRTVEEEVERCSGLPLRWYDVLLELNAVPGRRLRMQELAERVVLSRTRVSRVVDEIAAAGLVTREPNPDDGRSSFVVLTPAGRKALKAAAPVYLAAINAHFASRIPDESLPALRAALNSLAAPQPVSISVRASPPAPPGGRPPA